MSRTSFHINGVSMAAAILCIALLGSCRDTSGPTAVNPSMRDIATFTGNASRGAVFTLQQADDTTPVTLTASAAIDAETYIPGSRVYIDYTPASGMPYTSGAITLNYIANINTAELLALDMSQHTDWNATGVFLYSIWRTGPYINLHARLPYNPEPRKIALVIDKNSMDAAEAHLYFMHVTKPEYDTFERDYFMSYDLREFLSGHTPHELVVHVNNNNLPTKEFRFTLTPLTFESLNQTNQ